MEPTVESLKRDVVRLWEALDAVWPLAHSAAGRMTSEALKAQSVASTTAAFKLLEELLDKVDAWRLA